MWGFVPNSILSMQRRPMIARAFMDLNKAVLYEGTVPGELKMLVSLVTSQASGCRYCRAHMTNFASIDTIATTLEHRAVDVAQRTIGTVGQLAARLKQDSVWG